MSLWAIDSEPVELRPNASEEDLQTVIRAVYKQVLGNQHILEGQNLASAESLLRNGDISVRQFVNIVAKSELYQSLFFESSSPYRFVELNYKHLLGRAPQDQSEIAEHVGVYNEQGFEAEIDSYIDSDEYVQNFGENIVPYPRSTSSQTGIKNDGFNRMFALLGGAASNDSGNAAKLITSIGANLPTKISEPPAGSGSYDNTGKRFRIAVAKPGVGPVVKRSNTTYEVSYSQMSAKIQNIHKSGGEIVSITEVA
ncbi:MAG: photosystem I reaction center subunit XII [Oscillatoria sp. SIO1A7]|nr:photosystem I reaction center subunit XII [Oscillatoria sp. SIO1A7]